MRGPLFVLLLLVLSACRPALAGLSEPDTAVSSAKPTLTTLTPTDIPTSTPQPTLAAGSLFSEHLPTPAPRHYLSDYPPSPSPYWLEDGNVWLVHTPVDALWQMDATAFPPQQALTYLTFPDSLIDDQGRSIAPNSRLGGPTVTDLQTGGIQQEMHHYWEVVAPDTQVVTATMTVDLSNLHRQISLPLAWGEHQVNDVWPVDIPLAIGHAAVRVRQIEWVRTDTNDGLARLRLTVTDESPKGINLYCLHIDSEDPWQRTCANFAGELTYLVATPVRESVDLHLRAGLSLTTPFELVLNVGQTP